MVGLSFSWSENEAFYISLPHDSILASEYLDKLRPIFENDKTFKIGQNLKYDIMVLRNHNIKVEGKLFDTMIAHYLLQPELRHGMDYLAEIYLKYKTITDEELCGPKGKNQLPLRSVPILDLCDYACEDADVTLKLDERNRSISVSF